MWNPSWSSFPWKAWTSPAEKFEVLPTFVVGEFVMLALTVVLFFHAMNQGRSHLLIWLAALLSGTVNDVIFMALPLVDNFWQAQACIMLTPRMPLYIPCVYIVFLYCGTVAAWRIGHKSGALGALGTASLAGLMSEMVYSVYDITGAKFIWWTWHDTDAPIKDRLLGVPVGSSTWVITFSASFQLLLNLTTPKDVTLGYRQITFKECFKTLVVNGLLCTPLMMIIMSVVALLSGDLQGLPTAERSLLATITVCALLSIPKFIGERGEERLYGSSSDRIMMISLMGYFLYIFVNMILGVPENHISTGVHQTIGDCGVKALDLSGHERQVYLCMETHGQDFTFDCPAYIDRGNETNEWYTICGKPHDNKPLFLKVVGSLSCLGIAFYTIALYGYSE